VNHRSLIILACSAAKLHDEGGLPAIQRYDGPAYRVLRRALRERHGLTDVLEIRMLSAEFGLIAPWHYIPDYDREMTRERAKELRPDVTAALEGLWPAAYVHASHRYRLALPPPPWPVSIRVAHRGIGYQLAQLRAWLWELPL
jgi:hypothetical protein